MVIVFLIWFGITLAFFFITFVLLCAVLLLRTSRDSGYLLSAPLVFKVFGYLTLFLGLISDFILNLLLSIWLLELPHEILTTSRVSRLKNNGTLVFHVYEFKGFEFCWPVFVQKLLQARSDWQRSCARWLCRLLDSLDPGHCG